MKKIILLTFISFQSQLFSQNLIIDNTFGQSNGLSEFTGQTYSCIRQNDGKLLVTGKYINDSYISRFTSEGLPDITFGNAGVTYTQMAMFPSAENIINQPDGKFLVLGYSYITNTARFCVARFNSNGSMDNTFGTGGIAVIDIDPNYTEESGAFCLLPNGKIIIAGSSQINSAKPDYQLVRLMSNGSLDTSFGTNGVVFIDINDDINFPESIAFFPDGKLAITGMNWVFQGDWYGSVIKINSDGVLDNSFDGDGKIQINQPFISVVQSFSSVVQPDGKLLIGKSINTSNAMHSVMRINSNGSIDNSFGNSGISFVEPVVGVSNLFYSMALTPSNKIITVGASSTPYTSCGFAQLTSSGQMDVTFDNDGREVFQLDPNYSQINDILSIAEDTFIVCGNKDNQIGFISRVVLTNQVGLHDKFDVNNAITVFPNPTNSSIQITSSNVEINSLTLYDLFGKTVNSSNQNGNQLTISIENLNAGIYILKGTTANGQFEKRIIKQ